MRLSGWGRKQIKMSWLPTKLQARERDRVGLLIRKESFINPESVSLDYRESLPRQRAFIDESLPKQSASRDKGRLREPPKAELFHR